MHAIEEAHMSLRQGSLGPIEQRTLSDIVTARMRQAIGDYPG
jgi:hypothetical protein